MASTDLSRRGLLMGSVAGLAVSAALPALAQAPAPSAVPADTDWRHYANDLASTHYAPLSQIDASNFNDLEVAWRFKPDVFGARPEFNYQTTPLVVRGRLFTTAGSRRDVVSLDARTGEILWMHRFDEGERAARAPRQYSGHGVSYWTDGQVERILYVTIGYQLIALDAATGRCDPTFGVDGVVDLKRQLDQDHLDIETMDIGLHATPLVAGDVVIVGAAHSSGNWPATYRNVKGYVRGFDVRTGKRLWIFHTIPQKGEFGYDSWAVPGQAEATGNMGVWAEMSADPELGLAYLPVELPTGDNNGQYRAGNALYGESIVAVDIKTGVRRWHYQTEHHGLWDRDLPCAPILTDFPVNGRMVKALAQPTKQGFLFVLDRATGKPIWPIPEVKVEKGSVPGEWYSPTQPWPSKPPPFESQGVSIDKLIDFTPELRAQAEKVIANYKIGGLYTPPSLSDRNGTLGTLYSPGSTGGINWPGGSYDPETFMVYVQSKNTIMASGQVRNPGKDLTGSDFDYLLGVDGGPVPRVRGAMGAAAGRGEDAPPPSGGPPGRTNVDLNVQGLPLLKPPYGSITAIDLSKGDIAWRVPHGDTPDNVRNHPALKGLTIPRTGRNGNVGILVTKTLVISGEPGVAAQEGGRRGAKLRAYDKRTGEDRGAVFIPAGQTGTPMTYMLSGQQYVVVAVGGGAYTAELIAFPAAEAVTVRRFLTFALLATMASAPALAQGGSVWTGVFTADQAARGKATYDAQCAACHGSSLGGLEMAPALSGPAFLANWTGVSVGELATRIQTTMPADAPGSLSRRQAADVVAYVLSAGGVPAGASELPSDPSLASQLIGPAP